MGGTTVYVSITGLKVHNVWSVWRFWRHALPSMAQAKAAPGNISASARKINGIQHTLTVWESEAAMKRYIHSGAHREAIRAFGKIGTGKTFGFETDRVPEWSEVHDLWLTRGRDTYGEALKKSA